MSSGRRNEWVYAYETEGSDMIRIYNEARGCKEEGEISGAVYLVSRGRE